MLTRCWLALGERDKARRAADNARAAATETGLSVAVAMAHRAAAAVALHGGDAATAVGRALTAATELEKVGHGCRPPERTRSPAAR